jgi:hypothetical protein
MTYVLMGVRLADRSKRVDGAYPALYAELAAETLATRRQHQLDDIPFSTC